MMHWIRTGALVSMQLAAVLVWSPSLDAQPPQSGVNRANNGQPPTNGGQPAANGGQAAASGGQAAASGGQAAASNGQPFPALTAEQQARLDQLLTAWEQSSSTTERLAASFQRWQYRPLQAQNQLHATWAQGQVKYQAPAQGMYYVSDMRFFSGFDENKAPQYKAQATNPGEWWVCTGKELLEFDRANKKCEILELPPDMQGTQIVASPLPFVFNLKKNEMVQRYWIQELPPKQEGEFWLEAWPKNQQDRAEFKKVLVVIDAKQFLPKAMILFPPNFDGRSNPERDVYEFTDVQRNGNLLDKLSGWFGKDFINVKPPSDWQVIRKPFTQGGPPQMAQQPEQTPAGTNR